MRLAGEYGRRIGPNLDRETDRAAFLQGRLKQTAGFMAILAMAVHTLLWAVAMPVAATAGTVDPLAVICHSGADSPGPTDQNPAGTTHACEHCNVCSVAGTPAAPDVVLAGRLLPERVLTVLSPANVQRRDGVTSSPQLARGPPAFM